MSRSAPGPLQDGAPLLLSLAASLDIPLPTQITFLGSLTLGIPQPHIMECEHPRVKSPYLFALVGFAISRTVAAGPDAVPSFNLRLRVQPLRPLLSWGSAFMLLWSFESVKRLVASQNPHFLPDVGCWTPCLPMGLFLPRSVPSKPCLSFRSSEGASQEPYGAVPTSDHPLSVFGLLIPRSLLSPTRHSSGNSIPLRRNTNGQILEHRY